MNNIEKMREARKQNRIEGKKIYTNPIDAWEDSEKTSRALAIKAKCAECMGCEKGHLESGAKTLIKQCTSHSCPLHVFRPYQTA